MPLNMRYCSFSCKSCYSRGLITMQNEKSLLNPICTISCIYIKYRSRDDTRSENPYLGFLWFLCLQFRVPKWCNL